MIILNVYSKVLGKVQDKKLYRISKFIIAHLSGSPAQKGSCIKSQQGHIRTKKWRASSRSIVGQRLN